MGTTALAVIKTIPVGGDPRGVAVDDVDDTIYVANYGRPTVSVISGRTGEPAASVSVGTNSWGVAVDQEDDTVYVTHYYSGNYISVFNGRTGGAASSITLPAGSRPDGVAVDQLDDTVYVAGSYLPQMFVIQGRTNTLDDTIPMGNNQSSIGGVAVDDADDTVYITRNNDLLADQLWIMKGRSLDDSTPVTVGSYPEAVAVNQADDTVYITNRNGNNVSVINGRTGQRTDDTISVGIEPSAIAVRQTDGTVYVANYASDNVFVVNGRTHQAIATISVDDSLTGIAVDDSGLNAGLVYVSNVGSGTVSIIGEVTPTLSGSYGPAGTSLTLTLDVPQVSYDVDDSTVATVTFGGTAAGLTAAANDTWTVTVPAGSGTVPVLVTFDGGIQVSLGTFTYPTPPPPPAPLYPPGAPTDVTAVAGDDTALVSWTPPSSTGAGPITSYYVFSTPRTGSCTATPPTTSCVMTGLTKGTTYTFQVQAINIDGASSPSAPSNPVTAGEPPPPPPPTPSILITGSRDSHRITVTGTAMHLDSQTVRPWIKFPGQKVYTEGTAVIPVAADGSFTWSRKTNKKTYVYVAHGTTRSNMVTIPAR